MMNNRNNNDGHEVVDFKRIICVPIGKNKHAAISLANSKIFSLTQFVVVEFDDQKVNRFAMPGSIRLTKKALITLHKMLTFVIVRLKDNLDERLDKKQLDYIFRLQHFWTADLDNEVLDQQADADYLESNYNGETYDTFNTPIENIRRKN
jgi:hypothetical protein